MPKFEAKKGDPPAPTPMHSIGNIPCHAHGNLKIIVEQPDVFSIRDHIKNFQLLVLSHLTHSARTHPTMGTYTPRIYIVSHSQLWLEVWFFP